MAAQASPTITFYPDPNQDWPESLKPNSKLSAGRIWLLQFKAGIRFSELGEIWLHHCLLAISRSHGSKIPEKEACIGSLKRKHRGRVKIIEKEITFLPSMWQTSNQSKRVNASGASRRPAKHGPLMLAPVVPTHREEVFTWGRRPWHSNYHLTRGAERVYVGHISFQMDTNIWD